MKNQIINYVKAGYAGIYIVSHEEQRVESEVRAVAHEAQFNLFAWSVTSGVFNVQTGEPIGDTQDPMSMLDTFTKLPEKSILMLRDFHMFLADPNPMLFRKIKDVLLDGKASNRTLLPVGCVLKLPAELEKWFTVVEFKLPTREQLKELIEGFAREANLKINGKMEKIVDAASGLTTSEVEDAVSLSVVETKEVRAEIVNREKANTIRKNGIIEIVESKTKLTDIGGLENLKQDLTAKRNLFTTAAKEYGLPTPRGILMVGQPGTGKSLSATATANIFGVPLLRLEAGRLFGGIVGETERNWRNAFATAKAISPCVLWIDEVDGLTSGAESSGKTDGGTTARVIKTILQDMQFNGDGIFFVLTANDIDGLPDPLIDRMDVWSVDLPNQTEREAIWKIHITKRGRDPKPFNLEALAAATEGFSGRQIEQVWLKALTIAFNDGEREPKNTDAVEAAGSFTPTSVLMAEAIERRRKRLANKATPASAPETIKAVKPAGRKLAA
jgi:SpoVK/Ycf46/Vps4 family AAA+-type ATPase